MKFVLPIFMCLCFIFSSSEITAQESKWPELDKSPMQISYYPANVAWRNYLSGDDREMRPKVKVSYSSPSKKDRKIFGELLTYGKEWRLGANEATEVTFYQAVEIGGVVLGPGYYTMSATVNENNWTVHFSTQRHIWGSENRDQTATVASITVNTNKTKEVRENFAIGFKEIDDNTAHMVIEWDDTNVAIPVAFNVTEFPDVDKSPGDMAHYPDNSRFTNYLKPEEVDGAKPKMNVSYGRPQMKGRKIFGELLKYGEVWRVGANESTEVTFFENVTVGDTDLRAGRYNLYAIVNEKEWTFIFNTDMPAWGSANRNEEKDVATVTVPVTTDSESLEALSIKFDKQDDKTVHMVVGWDKTRAALPVKFK